MYSCSLSKFSRKKESGLLLLLSFFFPLKVRVAMRFTAQTQGCLKCKMVLKSVKYKFLDFHRLKLIPFNLIFFLVLSN